MSDNGNDIGAFLAGFVIGGLVGAATAIILAPQSGEETRAQISAKGSELRHVGEERIHEYRQLAGSAVEDARSRVQETTGTVQERARIVLDEGKSKVSGVISKTASESAHETETDETAADAGGNA
jgi:gas vesicle protein